MKLLALSTGGFAKVDDSDYDKAVAFTWWRSGRYAMRALPRNRNPKKKNQLLHVFLLGAELGKEIDHENGDGLDCQRNNLRASTHSQNLANRGKPRGIFTSRFKGVSWHRQKGRWRAAIVFHCRQRHLGLFEDEVKAALAYDKAAKEFFGEFAHLNF